MTADPESRTDNALPWRVRIGSEAIEVADEQEIRTLAESGKLRPEHYVFDPAQKRWMYARELSFLSSAFSTRVESSNPDAWLVQVAGRSFPLRDLDSARAWIATGRLTPASLIRNPVLQKWMRAGEVLELSDAFESAPPPLVDRTAQRSPLFDALVLGGIVLLVGAIIAALAFYSRSSAPQNSQAAAKQTAATLQTSTATAGTAPPKMFDYTFGVKTEKRTVDTATSSSVTPAAAASSAAPVAAAPATTTVATPAVAEVSEKPATKTAKRPARTVDEAEEEFSDEGGDVVFKPTDSVRATPSGDYRVYIDRNQRDNRYHVAGCTFVTDDMSAVSLDLARQSYRPCPVCKPPQ